MAAADRERTVSLMKQHQDLVTDMPASAFYTGDFGPA